MIERTTRLFSRSIDKDKERSRDWLRRRELRELKKIIIWSDLRLDLWIDRIHSILEQVDVL